MHWCSLSNVWHYEIPMLRIVVIEKSSKDGEIVVGEKMKVPVLIFLKISTRIKFHFILAEDEIVPSMDVLH